MSRSLSGGTMPASWGGVLDLIDESGAPDTSRRDRCTVHMDYVPAAHGAEDPFKIAFWTAEHCIKFSKAQMAELNLFDPGKKKYLRFPIQLNELERMRRGREIFARNAPDKQSEFESAVTRPDKGLIERGIPACKTDSATYLSANPGKGVVCSTVLDLARLEGFVPAAVRTRNDVADALKRLRAALVTSEQQQFARIDALKSFIPAADYINFNYWLSHWRDRVSAVTRWRGDEGFSGLIEQVRNCPTGADTELCSAEIRAFFSDSLTEYGQLAAVGSHYPDFLKSEANKPMSNTSHNLPWLIHSQQEVQKQLAFSGQAFFGTNLLKPSFVIASVTQTNTLGESGPLYYAAVTVNDMLNGAVATASQALVFKDKTILIPYSKDVQKGLSFLLQSGDSGSVFVLGNTPIGVISTVDGNETSGGASIRPLPEYIENDSAPPPSTSSGKTSSSVKCLQ
ncbi:MAG: hypothetical protein EBR09_02705 [Proteobacteria bacterium]|nr:hypothetical protein [Pseudomonadota bacterium]